MDLGSFSSPCLASAFETLTCSLTSLQGLTIHFPFSANAIRNAGRLTKLRSWMLILASEIPVDVIPSLFTSTDDCFPDLRNLSLHTADLDYAASIIQSLQRPLQTLLVVAKDRPSNDPSFIMTFTRVFVGHCFISSLTVLRLFVPTVKFQDQDIYSAFEPFFSLKNMAEFTIDNPCVVELDDIWFLAAANAWRHLKKLGLLSDGLPPKATLSGLIPLVQRCPDLESLRLTIVAKPFRMELLEVYNAKMKYIAFRSSPIENPVGVFRCLTKMFPNLPNVTWDGYNEDWQRISALLEESRMDAYVE
ncbi:hypothetical protein J132_06773 [Termitomyces sp. J132]|nr:hypothetical protein J132_06773 [Termitomyces sp. J132]